jgi:probable addiction module antidote protein
MKTSKKPGYTRRSTSRKKFMSTTDYKEWLLGELQDLDFAAGYITEAFAEGEEAFLLAIRDVVEAQGGVGRLAKKTELNREGLYDMLSDKGNPRLSSLSTLFDALGLQLAVTKKKAA